MNFPLLNADMKGEIALRTAKITQAMERAGLDAMLLGSSPSLLYLAGGIYNGYIYITSGGELRYFFIPPAESDNERVSAIRKPEMIPGKLQELGIAMPQKLGLEFDDLSYGEVERLKKVFEGIPVGNATTVMREVRAVKTPLELDKMREDGRKQAMVYSRIDKCYSEGMTELEFQIEIERMLRREGCLGFLRAAGRRMELSLGSVLAGDNADVPGPYDFSMGGAGIDPSLPAGASGTILKPGMAVMVDMNGGFNGYQSDMTRVWAVGKLPELAMRAHECSVMILHDLEKFARAGVEISEIYKRAVKLADEAGLHDYFMGHHHKVAFIGHGVGIELNEQPVIMERNHKPLEENMTIAIEPKFVIPGVGAVGIENTYIVKQDGLENITVLDEDIKEL